MSVQILNAVLNIITNVDYLAIPVAFIALRNLREPDVPPRVLMSRVLFVLFCGAHHGVMAAVLMSGESLWIVRTLVNVAMATVSCWSLVEHVLWARVRHAPVTLQQFESVRGMVAELERRNLELETTNHHLERFNRMAVGRELRMIELKQEVNTLAECLGDPARYDLSAVSLESGR